MKKINHKHEKRFSQEKETESLDSTCTMNTTNLETSQERMYQKQTGTSQATDNQGVQKMDSQHYSTGGEVISLKINDECLYENTPFEVYENHPFEVYANQEIVVQDNLAYGEVISNVAEEAIDELDSIELHTNEAYEDLYI